MGRLKLLAPVMRSLTPRLGRLAQLPDTVAQPSRSAQRDRDVVWRKWYKTARWQKLRWAVLTRDLFTCQMCKRIEADTSQLVGDHREPHRGNEALFWDEANLQCLCKACHDSTKQRDERSGR